MCDHINTVMNYVLLSKLLFFTAATRNYTMENIALELYYKCKNEELGCDVNVREKDKTAHEKIYNFR